jgi:beta-N-acetylhexosaminidase
MIPRIGFAVPLLVAFLALSCGGPAQLHRTHAPGTGGAPTDSVLDGAYPPLSFSVAGPFPSWVDSTLGSLSLQEKVAQLVMARAFGHYMSASSEEYERLVNLVTVQHVGGLAVFQGDVYESAVLLNRLQGLSRVPLLVAADYERGITMRTRRGTAFPDAMAFGATRNPDFAYAAGRAMAREARAIGVHQNFAPVADINNNPSNPVINTRSFGEDPQLVSTMAGAFIRGLNDGGVISTVKHFPGHGDTGVDSHLDLPVLRFSRARLDSLELAPFRHAVRQGVMSVMIAHLEVPALDPTPGLPVSLSPMVITGLLKGEMGFRGLVITDAMDMRGLVRGFPAAEAAVRALKAGVDILLLPDGERVAIDGITAAVRRGEISEARIDSSVRKILMAKQWLLLDEHPFADIDHIPEVVGSRENRLLARQIARSAITVARNDSALLPLQPYPKRRVVSVIISDTEDNRTEVNRPGSQWPNEPFGAYFMQQLRRRAGSVESHKLTPSSTLASFDSVLSRIARADLVLLPLYVKVRTASGSIGVPENLLPFLAGLRASGKPVVLIALGNPYAVAAFPTATAVLCSYGDSEPLVEATVEALFGEIDVTGRLPVTIPGLFPFGAGLQMIRTELRTDDPIVAGFQSARLAAVDSIVLAAIRDSTFPAAQVAVVKDGIIVLNRAYGTYTYDRSSPEIDPSTLFDLASVTKVVATTAAVMKLYDQKRLRLDDHVSQYLSAFGSGPKEAVTISQLLTHTAGFPPFRNLRELSSTPQAALDSALATPLVAPPGDTTIYSDLGMIALGAVVEQITGQPLDAYVRQEFYEPLKMINTTFRPSPAVWSQTAPTEFDSLWRKMLVRGTVHDENAAMLGGVAGHAGLFSTASDLAIFMQMIMNGGTYGGRRYLGDTTVALFTRRSAPGSSRGLGWDAKSTLGSTAGAFFSGTSFGHTGFTGTSIWADPERNLFAIFLTNRVCPTRANMKITRVRPAVHDAVIQALMPGAGVRNGRGLYQNGWRH